MTHDNDDPGMKPDAIDLDAKTQAFIPGQDKTRTTDGHQLEPQANAQSIGEYRIIRKIGEGGMGVVYEAEQQRPRRRVALKVVRGGLAANDHVVKMFEREIEALARLKHPGIASIYESGRSDDGQMFFAMELVQGVELNDFVKSQRVSTSGATSGVTSQLTLFSQICEVVNYAHQRGIIHRDLKPQNILVTDPADDSSTLSGDRVGVKILDFGLARINDPEFRGNTNMSEIGQIKGTLLYMSPEQVRGRPDEIDTRSDVYALGVILYEMLSGRMPYDLTNVSLPEAMRIICEEPIRPLNRFSSADGAHQTRIDRDVGTIVSKTLEKDPDRRYQSVAAMLEDIERYLTDQPILARPPSAYYQFRKLVARHRAAFASLAVIFLMLLGFGIVMAAQATRIANERDNAEHSRHEAEEQKNRAEHALADAETARNDALVAKNEESRQKDIAEHNLQRAREEEKHAQTEKVRAQNAQRAEQKQRNIAEQNLDEAKRQKAVAEKQTSFATEQQSLAEQRRIQAERQSEEYRKLLYVSQLNLAEQAWNQANVPRVQELLESQIPAGKESDLRGFEWYTLWQLTHAERLKLPSSPASVTSAMMSPDGRSVALASTRVSFIANTAESRTVLLDARTGQEQAHFQDKLCLGYLTDRTVLLTGKAGLEKVDLITGTATPTRVASGFSDVTISSNRRFAVTFPDYNTVELSDLLTGDPPRILRGVNGLTITRGAGLFDSRTKRVSNDGSTVVATSGARIMIWRIPKGDTPVEFAVRVEDVPATAALSPDGSVLATRSITGPTIRIWDTKTLQERGALTMPISTGLGLPRLEFSPDGHLLAATNGRTVLIWNVTTRELLAEFRGHGEAVNDVSFSGDGRSIVTAAPDSIKIWSTPTEARIERKVLGTMSADGSLIAAAGSDGNIQLWDPVADTRVATLGMSQPAYSASLLFPGLSYDGSILTVWRFGLPTEAQLAPAITAIVGAMGMGHTEVWDTRTRSKIGDLPVATAPISVLSPDGRSLAQVTIDERGSRSVTLWNVRDLKPIFSVAGAQLPAFSADGKTLVVSMADEIRFVDTVTQQEVAPSIKTGSSASIIASGPVVGFRPLSSVSALAFSPNDKILTYADGKDVHLWDRVGGKELGSLKGNTSPVQHIDFTPDGKRMVTVDLSGAVKLWDVTTCKYLLTLLDDAMALPVSFSPDGKTMVATSKQGMKVFKAATDEEVRLQLGH